jgi:hypothetical protein
MKMTKKKTENKVDNTSIIIQTKSEKNREERYTHLLLGRIKHSKD